ncbi:MAG: HAMP domain-containing protein [Anaerolineales bacterium]|nr:HAMP domain-containing protein [Anaerolineales bacterium]
MKRLLDGLRLQLLGIIILPLSLLFLAFAVVGVRIHQDAMRRLVAERDERSVRTAAAAIAEQLYHREAAMRSVALRFSDGASHETILEQADFLFEDFDGGLAVLDLNGNILASTVHEELWIGSHTDGLILKLKKHETRFSEVYLENEVGLLVFVAARGEDQVAIGAFTISSLMRTATLGTMTGSGSYSAFLTDRSGQVLTSVGDTLLEDPMSDHPGVQASLRGETGSSYLPAEDGEHVVAFSPILPTGWALIIEEPWETVANPVLNLSLIAPLVLVPVLGVMLIALWFGTRQVVSPLRRLEQKAGRLAGGDYDAVAEPVGGIAEIQHLQLTLTLMTQRIRAAQDALRGYINTMTRTQEDERRRLARELHDETIQDLIALGHQVQMIGINLKDHGLGDIQELRELQQSTQEAIGRVRRLSRGLRPIYLEDLGLIPALQMLARDTELELEIPVSFRSQGEIRRLDAETELAFYRIVQEALSNVSRHARAEHVWIHVSFEEDSANIVIRDDGMGFQPPDQTNDLAREGHYGLIGMVERAVLIGADLEIRSVPKEGTQITAHLPLNAN